MQRIVLSILVLTVFFSCKDSQKDPVKQEPEKRVTTYYLIRHAEKNRTDPTDNDPELTEKGLERARLWAQYFDSIPLSKLYTTNYKRTRQTIGYVANQKQIPAILYQPEKLVDSTFLKETQNKRVLIVGHSNTTPMLVNQLIGTQKYPDMDDSDNSSLYVVTLAGEKKSVEIRKAAL